MKGFLLLQISLLLLCSALHVCSFPFPAIRHSASYNLKVPRIVAFDLGGCSDRPAMWCLMRKHRHRASLISLQAKKRTTKQQKGGQGFGKVPENKSSSPPGGGDSLNSDQLLGALYHFAGQFEEMFVSNPAESQDDRGLTPPQLARERVLCSRLDGLALRRTKISTEGSVAGAGLFATRDIRQGELITCYPGDALVYSIPGTEDDGVIFGWHVPAELTNPEDCYGRWVDYGLFEDEEYAVIGVPDLDEDVAYAGHMCNDGAMLKAADEAAAREYKEETTRKRNAMHTDLDGLHMVTIATRDIAKGEEVLVSYGVDYWQEYLVRHALS